MVAARQNDRAAVKGGTNWDGFRRRVTFGRGVGRDYPTGRSLVEIGGGGHREE